MIRGRIEKALSGFYYVNTGAETLQCRARGKFRREGMSPLVGDWVQVRELGGGEGFVEAVEPRRNAFDRPAAANIDQLVIIASAALPVTDPYLIDRISAIAALKDCRVLLCLNKCDLDPAEELYGIYSGSAIRVLRVSAVTGQGIDELRRELACNLDDMTGEGIAFAMERLLAAGALDVYTLPIGMKKSRPGVMLCVLCREEQREDMVHLLLRHTTTLGVRETRHRRYTLSRSQDTVNSPWGPVARKTSQGWGVRRQKPEYEDLARIAREQDLTLDQVRDGLK